ncbi:NAD(P)H-dependent oxidoreductase [Fusibacter sp. 3D3]|uniref:NAD(P)H-dependent oxidoreductase n=1 Tax=Fusibacter sp. 3D3 TaxID=1048380 RepID=UPI0008536407|nr:NAD(P)H-dependent oxidoreductase [Fusibacter sp. 3D3]GAU76159.1 iron-sulfur flavoprotein [Fusibacter sp. 3D3]
MNILMINGSPRHYETYHLLNLLESKLRATQPSITSKIIDLKSLNLKDCTGCHLCILKDEALCLESEKLHDLTQLIHQADLIILASPVYNDHVTALMKKWFDFMTYLWHRPEFFGKPFVLVSSGGGSFKPIFKYMSKNVKAWGGYVLYEMGIPHLESLTPKFKEKSMLKIEQTADIILHQLKSSNRYYPTPKLTDLLWFNIWKLNAYAARDTLVKDNITFTKNNWFEMQYYYDARIPLYRLLLSSVLTKIIKHFMKKVYLGY